MAVISMIGGTEAGDVEAVRYALTLAQRMNRPLKGYVALPDASTALLYATSPYMVGVGGAAIEGVRKAQEDMIAAWKEMFEKTVAESGGGHPAHFEQDTVLTERGAARAAVIADTLVFPREAGCPGHSLSEAYEHVLMNARLPVVLSGTSNAPGGPALVAWDGSQQAARAVRFHLPFLKVAGRALIAQNPSDLKEGEQNMASSPESFADWLAGHGIESDKAGFEGDVAKGLLGLAREHGAEAIVSGAYGHSRAGQFLFGGTTRALHRADEAPALVLAH